MDELTVKCNMDDQAIILLTSEFLKCSEQDSLTLFIEIALAMMLSNHSIIERYRVSKKIRELLSEEKYIALINHLKEAWEL